MKYIRFEGTFGRLGKPLSQEVKLARKIDQKSAVIFFNLEILLRNFGEITIEAKNFNWMFVDRESCDCSLNTRTTDKHKIFHY